MYIAIIGDDQRMNYVAERLYTLGIDIGRDLNNLPEMATIILPPPVSKKKYEYLMSYIDKISRIYGGAISEDFINMLPDRVSLVDYLKIEDVVYENAILTAFGIIDEALSIVPTFENVDVLITGYGYCGKAIAKELIKQGAKITIAVRKKRLKKEIIHEGYSFIELSSMYDRDMSKYKLIFNTIPALVIDKALIDILDSSIYIFDIASSPGGVDFEYCNSKNIFARLSLGIPGKYYPKEAGYIIANSCYNHLNL